MYLKRLEIRGFKSFAEEIEIEFGPGITVIVGPNGCGKSNLTEAVQWVLGEQNPRALRGYKMDDFIFAGTSKRPPLGMAEVTLVFDNKRRVLPLSYEEVSITRRLYRSGESEYFINKRPCRLRQIQELLASCGIGRAAFSVIAQGMIDEFLTTKPEERRIYLEEAAGVARYRQRKSEALARLEETEQALLRLEDVLKEIERQRLPLVKQAEMANRYKFYKTNLRELERRLLEGQLCRIKQKKNLLSVMYQKTGVASEEDKQRVERLEGELEELASEIHTVRKRINELEESLSDVKKEKDGLNISRVRLEERLSSLFKKKSEVESRLEEVSEEHRQLMNELQVVEDAYANSLRTRSTVEREYEDLKKQEREWEEKRETVAGFLKECETEIFDVLHRKTALSNKIHQLRSKRELISRQLENLKERVNDGKRKIVYITQHLSEKEKLFEELSRALTDASVERERLRSSLEELRKKKNETEKVINETLQKLERDKARLSVLEEAERNKEGYERGVKAVLQAVVSGHLSSGEIIGLVEDLLLVEPRYEKALQAALGRASHYLVCTTPEAAQKAIEYLKAHRAGRASFLPLSAVECWMKHQLFQPTLRGEGIIGRAADLVMCELRYKCISEFLLGRTYFAEDLHSARVFAEDNHYKVRVVTLDGDMINPGGLITGGKALEISCSLQRKKEIAVLSKVISEREKILTVLKEEERRLAAEISAIENKLSIISDCYRQIESKRNALNQEIASLNQELKQLNDFVEEFQVIKEDGGYRSDEVEQELSQLQEEYGCVVRDEEMLLSRKTTLEAERNSCDSELRDIQRRLEDLRIELVKLDQQMKYLEYRKQSLQEKIKRFQDDQTRNDEELEEICKEISLLQIQHEACLDKLAELHKREVLEVSELEKRRNRLSLKEAYYRTKEKRCSKLKQMLLQRQQERRNIEAQMEHLEEQLKQIEARAAEIGFCIEEDMGTEELNPQEELELKKRIVEFREKLEALGEVNQMAPAELRELDERYEFLKHQKEDLERGKKKLESIVAEMDKIAIRRFYKTYQEIGKNFAEIYSALCEGGKARLILTDESDLLKTGVDILIMPKGKKPRHLSLLSGGEKALVGISFLFALLKTHASPFYLLDEIDAFLDEANLSRFADFLGEMGKEHQLILITHRYQTMQVADALYGITMEEPGVSKVVSVRLNDWGFDEERTTAS